MICASCRSETRPETRKGILVEICPSCRGIWVYGKQQRMLALDPPFLNGSSIPLGEAFKPIRLAELTICPQCRELRLQPGYLARLKVSACGACKGIFIPRQKPPAPKQPITAWNENGVIEILHQIEEELLIEIFFGAVQLIIENISE